ncbi:hypothetical protein [Parasitella parasitica]|uniref:Uncharacterized protein n=1 Tax=Parasitella parasitica TaxID=35722 RepID=A0A0B7NXH4_9FUNG|nr:hypothetical protein [Parasitella parasitica]
MRTHTLFAIAVASFLINFSEAATLNKRIEPLDGVLATVAPGGVGNLPGTAAGSVPLTGGVLGKRGIVDGLLGVGGGASSDASDQSRSDDEFTKRSGLPVVGDLSGGGLPVVGDLLGGGGKASPASAKKGQGQGKGQGKGKGKGKGAASNEEGDLLGGLVKRNLLGGGLPVVGGLLGDDAKATPASAKKGGKDTTSAKEGGLLGGLVKRDLLGGGLPIVGGLLGDEQSGKKVEKAAAKGRGRKSSSRTQASGGGALPIVGGLLG